MAGGTGAGGVPNTSSANRMSGATGAGGARSSAKPPD